MRGARHHHVTPFQATLFSSDMACTEVLATSPLNSELILILIFRQPTLIVK